MDRVAWQLAGIFFLTWLSEDAAVLSAAIAAATGALPAIPCFLSCFGGLWSGDFLLFLLARYGGRPLAERFLGKGTLWEDRINRSELWFSKRGVLALAVSRFVPGMRLTTFLAAGFLKMNTLLFAVITGLMAIVWTILVFLLVHLLGEAAPGAFHNLQGHLLMVIASVLLIMALIRFLPPVLKRLPHWEFWPGWFYYLPITARYLARSVQYGSLTLPTAANPGIRLGGLIGESKWETLSQLAIIDPTAVPATAMIPAGEEKTSVFESFMQGRSYPVVMKPDVGFRGSGFRLIRNHDEAMQYLHQMNLDTILQEYIPWNREAGILYIRFPDQERGTVIAVTEKVFPKITGDGKRTIRELILGNTRASMQAAVHLARFQERLDDILAEEESLRLVEAGSHTQGCLFKEGGHLLSPKLLDRVDAISRQLPGFFIGRYDVRFRSPEELAEGEFRIMELNGVGGEPTNAYDPHLPLGRSYSLMFRHWDLAFALGAANRKRGHRPDSAKAILREWFTYNRLRRRHPVAD